MDTEQKHMVGCLASMAGALILFVAIVTLTAIGLVSLF